MLSEVFVQQDEDAIDTIARLTAALFPHCGRKQRSHQLAPFLRQNLSQ